MGAPLLLLLSARWRAVPVSAAVKRDPQKRESPAAVPGFLPFPRKNVHARFHRPIKGASVARLGRPSGRKAINCRRG
jgi:hypothetical protein